MTELELVHQAKAGNRAAYGELLDPHAARAYRVALHFLGTKADAEDACQNAFLKAFSKLGYFEERSSFATWLLRIVAREALNLRRAESTRFAFWQRHGRRMENAETVESIIPPRGAVRDGLHRFNYVPRWVRGG